MLPTFKFVGDNVDKHVTPRNMTVDAQAQSLHLFNVFAVLDRVDMSHLEDSPSLPQLSECDVKRVLPTEEDQRVLYSNFVIHAIRVLKKYMPFFSRFATGLDLCIHHRYEKEMEQRSKVVWEVVYCNYYIHKQCLLLRSLLAYFSKMK